MLIKETFSYIKCGKDKAKMHQTVSNDVYVKKIKKDSMQNSKFLITKFVDFILPYPIDSKYFLQKEDIVISLKEPYSAAALYDEKLTDKVLIPNHYVVLRNIDSKKYNYIFVVNYLNLIGLKKLEKLKKIDSYSSRNGNSDLTIYDIENIELPDISLSQQESIINLCNAINDRAVIYETIKDNDKKIIEFAMKELVGDKNV